MQGHLPADGPDAAERFRQLQDWLNERGSVWEQLVEDAIFVRASPPDLALYLSNAHAMRLAAQVLADPDSAAVLREGVGRFFPGCERVRTDLRPETSPLRSRRELNKAAYEARLVQVRGEIEVHPLIRRARDLLGAEIESVSLVGGP